MRQHCLRALEGGLKPSVFNGGKAGIQPDVQDGLKRPRSQSAGTVRWEPLRLSASNVCWEPVSRFASADVDFPRLHRLGDLADQLDGEQAVLQVGAAHLNMVGQREAPLERARGDAAIDVIGAALVRLSSSSRNDQHVLLGGDVDLFGLEAGDGQLNPKLVVTKLDEVERGIILLGLAGLLFSSMSNSRSKPTVERRNGAKSKALRMSCPPLEQQGGAEDRSLGPVTGPDWRPAL